MFQQIFSQCKPLSALITKDIQSQRLSAPGLDVIATSSSKKSVLFAIIASLIVPGMGELYAGSFESGKYHLIAECGLWLTYAGFRVHSNWISQDAQMFAKEHADANFDNKDEKYAVNIGNFKSTSEYNETKSINREYDLIYFTDLHPDYIWNWDSDANRIYYKDRRIRSDQIKNDAKFIIGVVVVNHIISAFSAARKTVSYNKSISMIDNLNMHAYTLNNGSGIDGLGLNITANF
jgi:hypothetical protein